MAQGCEDEREIFVHILHSSMGLGNRQTGHYRTSTSCNKSHRRARKSVPIAPNRQNSAAESRCTKKKLCHRHRMNEWGKILFSFFPVHYLPLYSNKYTYAMMIIMIYEYNIAEIVEFQTFFISIKKWKHTQNITDKYIYISIQSCILSIFGSSCMLPFSILVVGAVGFPSSIIDFLISLFSNITQFIPFVIES